jgi:hypothetical protein
VGSENNNRYGSNKNSWKKVYGYSSHKPRETTIIDTANSVTYSLDLNKTLRHRDFFIIKSLTSGAFEEIPIPPAPVATTEYDEGVVHFAGISDVGTGSFNFTFSGSPYVVLTIESSALYGNNLNVWGESLSTAGFTFGLSAPFTGSIRYRAIYADTYPAYVTSAYTASITASAGTYSAVAESFYTASFAALPSTTSLFLNSAWGTTGQQDVALQPQVSSSAQATVEFSSPTTSTIYFIAFCV